MRHVIQIVALLLLSSGMGAPALAQSTSPTSTSTSTSTSMVAMGTAIHKATPRAPVHHAADAPSATPVVYLGNMKPVMDHARYFHGIMDELEGRYSPNGTDFRWDGEAWYGTDYNRVWLKSEGTLERGRLHDGDHELLYSRAISSYFNLQGGVRADIDDGPTRTWGALGVQGLALYQLSLIHI